MKEVQPSLEKQNISPEKPFRCSQCGWPGTGTMPARVAVIKQEGKIVLAGNLSYFRIRCCVLSAKKWKPRWQVGGADTVYAIK